MHEALAGYSGTPLLKKLGIKEGARVSLVNVPRDFREELGPLPEGVEVVQPSSRRPLDFILVFVKSQRQLGENLSALRPKLSQNGMLWVAWPKKSSGVATDISFTEVQAAGLALGIVDTKVCAVNDIWSGLKFVIRLKDRVAAP
ncbi:MAG TPA: DUF3052 family protein [Pyrinomonadaceae bacterium]|nr:DUF3052 family protein [Pyrinomonadaceae bacterium]